MSATLPLTLSALSGFIALSYEILWYRVYSIGMESRVQAFAVLLAGYLFGLALGSLLAQRVCGVYADRSPATWLLALGVAGANILGFLFAPAVALAITLTSIWLQASLGLAVTSAGLGVVLPIATHLGSNGRSAGAWVSYIYAANVCGSVTGVLLTGLVLMDLPLRETATGIGLLGLASAALLLLSDVRSRVAARWGVAGLVAAALAMYSMSPVLYSHLYEKLTFKRDYRASDVFAHVIENRSGVITVTPAGVVYQTGVYEGVFNTDLAHANTNGISRAFAIGAIHPSPKKVLMIGVGTGSWAQVVAYHQFVESVTIVEINPGYQHLLSLYPSSEGLLSNPRVHFEIDDGRRWLQRHPNEKFDLIIGNTTFNWRGNATSVLSTEFLAIIREHLADGGVYYYNTTGEPRVERTGTLAFPYVSELRGMLAVSDAPIHFDAQRFRRQLAEYRIEGKAVFDLAKAAEVHTLDGIVSDLSGRIELRSSILNRTTGLEAITDDNMGTEWNRSSILLRRP